MASMSAFGFSSMASRAANLAKRSESSESSSCCSRSFESETGPGIFRVSDFLARFGRRFFVGGVDFGIAPSEDPDDDVRTRCCWFSEKLSSVSGVSVWIMGLTETETPESGLEAAVVRVSTWKPTSRSNGRLST